jgi:rubredoxin
MFRFICPNCDYIYDEAIGAPREGWAAGTPFATIYPDWCCPDCGVREQQDYLPLAADATSSS